MDELRNQLHRGEQIEIKTNVAASADVIARLEDVDGTRTAAYDFLCTGETRCASAYDPYASSVYIGR
jgi:hypothetical protein